MNFLLLVALATVASAFPQIPDFDLHQVNLTSLEDERIIGGKEVVKNRYPFVVRLDGYLADGSGYLCGGTLINENYVVTAAHCVYSEEQAVVGVTLHFGDHNMWHKDDTQTTMKIPMNNIYRHAEYHPYTVNNDIALIRLPSRAPISAYVQPICVASAQTVSRYGNGRALGWGLTHNKGQTSDVLKEVDLPILHHGECRLFGSFNPNTMMCAGNTQGIQQAICSGDSGGPFVVDPNSRPTLTGISSYVSSYGCVTVGYGVVFVRVSNYIPWLRNIMGNALCVA